MAFSIGLAVLVLAVLGGYLAHAADMLQEFGGASFRFACPDFHAVIVKLEVPGNVTVLVGLLVALVALVVGSNFPDDNVEETVSDAEHKKQDKVPEEWSRPRPWQLGEIEDEDATDFTEYWSRRGVARRIEVHPFKRPDFFPEEPLAAYREQGVQPKRVRWKFVPFKSFGRRVDPESNKVLEPLRKAETEKLLERRTKKLALKRIERARELKSRVWADLSPIDREDEIAELVFVAQEQKLSSFDGFNAFLTRLLPLVLVVSFLSNLENNAYSFYGLFEEYLMVAASVMHQLSYKQLRTTLEQRLCDAFAVAESSVYCCVPRFHKVCSSGEIGVDDLVEGMKHLIESRSSMQSAVETDCRRVTRSMARSIATLDEVPPQPTRVQPRRQCKCGPS